MRSPFAGASSDTMYMANRAGRSRVTTGATAVGAAEATKARARQDRSSFMMLLIGAVVMDDRCFLDVPVPLYTVSGGGYVGLS